MLGFDAGKFFGAQSGECQQREMRDGGGAYVIKGLSTYFNANGEQRGQWSQQRGAVIAQHRP